MIRFQTKDDYQPIAIIGNVPVNVTILFVVSHALAFFAAVVAGAGTFAPLAYNSDSVLGKFAVWQLITYPWVHSVSLWFVVEMVMVFVLGREVERMVGHRGFIAIIVTLTLASSLWLTLTGLFSVHRLQGTGLIALGILLVFAAIYPSAELILRLQARWVATLFAGAMALYAASMGAWQSVCLVAVTCFAALFCAKSLGIHTAFAWFESRLPRKSTPAPPVRYARPIPVKPRAVRKSPEPDAVEQIDPILEKISRHGISSLTPEERKTLESARRKLIAKDSH